MLNRWEGIGNLGKEPETRYTTDERQMAICRFTIAVDKGYGEKKKTVWVNIVAFGKTAEVCQRFLAKGRKVYVAGELDIREYEKQDGSKGYITEVTADKVEFLSGKEEQSGFPQQTQYTKQSSTYYTKHEAPQQTQFITRDQYEAQKPVNPPGFTSLSNEDIPF